MKKGDLVVIKPYEEWICEGTLCPCPFCNDDFDFEDILVVEEAYSDFLPVRHKVRNTSNGRVFSIRGSVVEKVTNIETDSYTLEVY